MSVAKMLKQTIIVHYYPLIQALHANYTSLNVISKSTQEGYLDSNVPVCVFIPYSLAYS